MFAVELGTHLGEERIIPKRDPLLEVTCGRGGHMQEGRMARTCGRLWMGFELQIGHEPVSGTGQKA